MAFMNVSSLESFLSPPEDGLKPLPPSIFGLTDAQAATIVPIASYWIASIFYETADYWDWFPQYRVYPSGEEQRRNLVTREKVLRIVLIMQAVQIVFGLSLTALIPLPAPSRTWGAFASVEYFGLTLVKSAPRLRSIDPRLVWTAAHALRLGYLGLRQLAAFFIFDTWAYWFHYVEHNVPWLYRMLILCCLYEENRTDGRRQHPLGPPSKLRAILICG
jgi:sphinganine C4-monooxygenase